jgi:5-methylcytosine-specific restriction endonuclease McrA
MMGAKLPTTPRSKVKQALRRLWLQSRERSATLKRDKYSCVKCGKKQSVAKGKEVKVHVHHKDGIDNWEELVDLIFEKLLISPDHQETLCVDCHKEEHGREENI